MQMYQKPPLIKNKLFLAALVLAILCSVTSISLFFYIVVHLDSCIAWNACSQESSGYYDFCVRDGYKFCCGGWGTDSESCGPYINNCRRKNDGFIECEPVFKAEVALFWISVFFWVCMIVIACIHRRKPYAPPQQQNYSLMSNPNQEDNRQ